LTTTILLHLPPITAHQTRIMNPINYHQPFILPPNRVWRTYSGGRILDQIQGKPDPACSHFPEDWIGSATRAVNPGR